MPNTLIASLGQSPAVITETLDCLHREKGLVFDRLIIIAPGQLPLVQNIKAFGFLQDQRDFEFLTRQYDHYPTQIEWSDDLGYLVDFTDIGTKNDANAFFKATLDIINHYCPSDQIYFAIAGGRKAMSALMVLAAQLVSVNGIYHVLLSDENAIDYGFAKFLRDDNQLMEYLARSEGQAGKLTELQKESWHRAFHPSVIELVAIEYHESFTEETKKRINEKLLSDKSFRLTSLESTIFEYALEIPKNRDESLTMPDFESDDFYRTHLDDHERAQTLRVMQDLWTTFKFIETANGHSSRHYFWTRNLTKPGIQLNESRKYEISIFVPMSSKFSLAYHFFTTAVTQAQADYCLFQLRRSFDARQKHEKSKKVLISTLGQSPGVVTTAVHYYEQHDSTPIIFDKIAVVAPDNSAIRENCINDILRQKEAETFGNRLDIVYFEAGDIRDGDDIDTFMAEMKKTVQKYVNDGYEIYLNLAGGRKVMSGALLLLAQLYPVKEAFHISPVDPALDRLIEEYGDWKSLQKLKNDNDDRYHQVLYPDNSTIEKIELPIHLFQSSTVDE